MDKGLPDIRRILELAKEILQTAPLELEVYYNENFGTDLKGERTRQRNKTNYLRIYKGGIARALQPKAPGNITKVEAKDGKIIIESGIDTDVVRYARIHEKGGTIKHPGGTPYMIGEGGRAVFLKKGDPRATGITKPHPIEMPARPYLAPGMQKWEETGLPRYIKRLMKLLGGK